MSRYEEGPWGWGTNRFSCLLSFAQSCLWHFTVAYNCLPKADTEEEGRRKNPHKALYPSHQLLLKAYCDLGPWKVNGSGHREMRLTAQHPRSRPWERCGGVFLRISEPGEASRAVPLGRCGLCVPHPLPPTGTVVLLPVRLRWCSAEWRPFALLFCFTLCL